MRRCYVNKPVRHVPPPPFYPRQTSDTQSEAYLLQRAVTLRHRTGVKPLSLPRSGRGLPACTYRHPFPGKLLHPFMNEFGFEYGFGFFTVPDTLFITLIFGPVNFAHPRINSSQHAGCAVFAPRPLRHCHERGNANHRQIRAKRQPPAQYQYQCARR